MQNSTILVNGKTLTHLTLLLACLTTARGVGAAADPLKEGTLRGVINDFTPISTGGPWELRGPWSLVLKGCGKSGCLADFTAALTMERSDQGVAANGGGDYTGANPGARMAHTHHIALVDGQVTTIAGGIEIKGSATITGNGSFPPPFQRTRTRQRSRSISLGAMP